MVLESLTALLGGQALVDQLSAFLVFVRIVYTLAFAGIGFFLARKALQHLLPEYSTELAAIAFVMLALFAWFYIFASLLVTGGTILLFYFASPVIVAGVGVLGWILR